MYSTTVQLESYLTELTEVKFRIKTHQIKHKEIPASTTNGNDVRQCGLKTRLSINYKSKTKRGWDFHIYTKIQPFAMF